jgi:CDGSH-type Zn-finger protein
MAEVRIKALKNGPYEVKGPVDLVHSDGQTKPAADDPIYLCRCGHSATKPYCDGSHKKAGFQG